MTNWEQVASDQVLEQTAAQLTAHGMTTKIVANKTAALAFLREHIPAGGEVMTGSSTTLHEIGFMELLQSAQSPWLDLHAKVGAENDEAARARLRRQASAADYFVASANAITQSGALVACDFSGSRVTAFPFAAGKLILVVGAQKIVPDLDTAMKRVREYVFPLEDARALKAYGGHSGFGKWVIVEQEVNPDRIQVVLVKEKLGF